MRKQAPQKDRKQRELLLTISVFLLGREELRNQFWNIVSTKYESSTNQLNVGISTVEGKYGTTLQKLRKTAKHLSQYLYDQGLTFRKSHIHFFVHKEENELARIEHLLDTIEAKLK